MAKANIRQLHSKWQSKGSKRVKDKLLREIWEVYHPKLQVYLNQMGVNGEDIPDIVSDLLLYVFENLDRYNADFAFSTWIYTISRNRMIDRVRKKQPALEELGDHHSSSTVTPEDKLIREEEKDHIRLALSRLKESDRELVYLHFYENMKYREMAGVTGLPEGTVKYRMSEIRKMMKETLQGSLAL